MLGLAALVAAGAGGAIALLPSPAAPVPERPRDPPRPPFPVPAWVEVANPFQAYDLAGGFYAKLPLRYAARRDHTGEGREDTLTYGSTEPGQAFLRIVFLRRGSAEVETATAFLDAARLAAGAGLAVTRSGLAARLDTRFGPFDTAGVSIRRADRAADCLAFRLADPAALPVLALTGLACGTVGQPIDAVTLGCTIDRLDLVSAGDDEALRAVFVAAERRRRDTCAARAPVPVRLGASDAGGNPQVRFRGPL